MCAKCKIVVRKRVVRVICENPKHKQRVNTSGAGMSEAYVHGFNLVLEGVRQIRGTSTSQVADAQVSLVTSGEGVPTSAILFTGEGV